MYLIKHYGVCVVKIICEGKMTRWLPTFTSTYELGSNTRVLYPDDKSIHDREPYIKVTGTLGSS